jgi:hypothetical protein
LYQVLYNNNNSSNSNSNSEDETPVPAPVPTKNKSKGKAKTKANSTCKNLRKRAKKYKDSDCWIYEGINKKNMKYNIVLYPLPIKNFDFA